ncbi:MAG: rod shape-determining protein MreD [Deltaproteobacteria bacterium]|nr:rod shape-determining protein MreD [Deltaproteobacteria bacterium]
MSRRNFLLLFLSVLASMILQVSVLPVYLISSFKPDLLLIIMVFLGLRGSFETGTPLAWLLGLLKDSFSGLYLGLNAFSFLLIFFAIKSTSDRLYADSPGLFVLAVCAASLACSTINLILLLMFTYSGGILYSIFTDIVPYLLVNSFAASLLTLFPWFDNPQESP